MDILILGGTGTISRQVSLKLIDKGHMVWILNRQTIEVMPGAVNLKGNADNSHELHKLISGLIFDTVIDFLVYNINVAKARYELFKSSVKQYIFISSATVYGCENNQSLVDENTPVGNKYSQYAKNKIECEKFFMKKWDTEGFPITIIRPSQTYDSRKVPLGIHGKYGSWQNVLRMLQGKPVIIHGKGTTMWSMTRSEDLAEWLSDILCRKDAVGEIFQLITDESMSWKQIYTIVSDELGKRLNAVYIECDKIVKWQGNYNFSESLWGDKARNITFNNSKRKQFSAYTPQIDMETGIRRTVRNVMRNPSYQVEDIEFNMWCDRVVEFLYK